MLKTYKLSPEGIERQIKKSPRMNSFMLIIWILIMLIPSALIISRIEGEIIQLIPTLIITAIIMCFAIYKGVKNGKKIPDNAWKDYELVVIDDKIIKKGSKSQDIEFSKDEIVNCTLLKDNSLYIKTKNAYKYLIIPSEIDDYEEIKDIIKSWEIKANIRGDDNRGLKLLISSALTVGLMYLTFFMYMPIISLIAAIILMFVIVINLVFIWKNPMLDIKVKKMSLAQLLFLFGVVLRLISILSNMRL